MITSGRDCQCFAIDAGVFFFRAVDEDLQIDAEQKVAAACITEHIIGDDQRHPRAGTVGQLAGLAQQHADPLRGQAHADHRHVQMLADEQRLQAAGDQDRSAAADGSLRFLNGVFGGDAADLCDGIMPARLFLRLAHEVLFGQ